MGRPLRDYIVNDMATVTPDFDDLFLAIVDGSIGRVAGSDVIGGGGGGGEVDVDEIAAVVQRGVVGNAAPLVATQPSESLVTRDPNNPVWTVAESALTSVFWPWVIRVADGYRMYLSNDHQGSGGVEMLTATSLWGPWTSAGVVYTAGDQTETPSVIYNEVTGLYHLFHQRLSGHTGGGQATYLATSADGISSWTDHGVILDSPVGTYARAGGGGHTGYFRPFRLGQWWAGYHLVVGGNRSRTGISYSRDGIQWFTDPRPIGKAADQVGNGRQLAWIQGTPVRWQGRLWLVHTDTDFAAGIEEGDKWIAMSPLSDDFRQVLAPPRPILTTLADSWEDTNMRTVYAFVDRGDLHIWYKSGGTQVAGSIGHAVVNPDAF